MRKKRFARIYKLFICIPLSLLVANFSIASSPAFSDFNADGKSDLLWRNSSTGDTYAWLMNGLTIGSSGYLPQVTDQNWQIAGIGDLDGDGKADIVWRNSSTGENDVWLMNGLSITSDAYLPAVSDANWKIVGVSDLNGDGKADILWRNAATGENYLWLMNGMSVSSGGYLPTVADQNWKVAGLGDLNGDSKADVVWRNTSTGETYAWLMNGLSLASGGYLTTVADQNWKIQGVADLDGNGKADVVWRNVSSGENYLWQMNGLSISGGGYLATVADQNWKVASLGDVNGDGKSDIFWRNVSTGENHVWLMNGIAIDSGFYLPTVADHAWQVQAYDAGSGQTTYSVGGTVSGINGGASFALLDNYADALTISANGLFQFWSPLASGADYQVALGTSPSGQHCSVTHGGPAVITANITNVQVACTAATPGNVIAQHALAQTGLAVALASTVLQSQLQIIVANSFQHTSCSALTGGGSVLGNPTANTVTVYYDNACSQPYILANPVSTKTTRSDGVQLAVAETATYYSPGTGAAIGTMAMNETAFLATATNAMQLYGTGTFTPAGSAPTPVQLGLYCSSIPLAFAIGTTSLDVPCAGGVAQDFPALNLALGAVTPLTLTIGVDPTTGAATNVTFAGGGTAVTGPQGSLTLSNPSPNSLLIKGGSAYTTSMASGGAAAFALFPPMPTAWTLTDATDDEQLQISVIDNTTRSLSMTITRASTGSTLATATLDQSGTGSIHYSDGSTAAITSWTLAD